MTKRSALAALVFLAGSAPAFAHLDPGTHGSFMAGVSHPLFGLDHILAMLAVGLWASQASGRALWAVPGAFVGMMSFGFAMGLSGLSLPFVEPAILASVVVLGLLVATAVRLPAGAGAMLVGGFALFHGHAHAGELGAAGAAEFGLGFVVATVLLHLVGIGLGLALGTGAGLGRQSGAWLTRAAGAATAAAGLALMAG